jgi:virginiamycin B lyase
MFKLWLAAIPAAFILGEVLQGCGGGVPTTVPAAKTGRVQSSLSAATVTNEYAIPSPNSVPVEIANGPDGALWFAERAAGRLGRITTAGAISEIVMTGPARFQFGVTTGSDGNVWSTGISVPVLNAQEGGAPSPDNAVFRTTTSGVVNAFALPKDSFPKQIVSGPDGSLWFVERYGKIGRITTTGAITEFSIPGGGPAGITVGPDGALWFGAVGGDFVGRITTSGTISKFPLPNGAGPFGVATGADGNLWITEYYGDRIARMTTSGAFIEYALTTGSLPRGIVAAPDGNLYFTESGTGKIGQITTAGAIVELSIPTANRTPTGIAVGPDGNLWFTEQTGNKIGKITL